VLLALRRRAVGRRTVAAVAVCAALLGVWTARGLRASGCPLFPSQVACATSVPWATPASIADEVASWIKSWARMPGAPYQVVLASWDWLRPWGRAMASDPLLYVVASLALAGAVMQALRPRAVARDVLVGWSIALAGTTAWFLTAPTPRFGLGFLFAAALVPLAGSSLLQGWAASRRGRAALAAAALVACVIVAAPALIWMKKYLTPANAAWVEFPRLPRAFTVVRQTSTGLRVNVPARGDQCWSAPLPCTPYFDPALAYEGMFTTAPGTRHP
jgi:hypothetical protein